MKRIGASVRRRGPATAAAHATYPRAGVMRRASMPPLSTVASVIAQVVLVAGVAVEPDALAADDRRHEQHVLVDEVVRPSASWTSVGLPQTSTFCSVSQGTDPLDHVVAR